MNVITRCMRYLKVVIPDAQLLPFGCRKRLIYLGKKLWILRLFVGHVLENQSDLSFFVLGTYETSRNLLFQ